VSDELPVLWQYSFSNYNEKARWALDYKGIRHRRRSVMPGSARGLWMSRGDLTLPVLDLDGGRVVDSTAIIAALEERQPEPSLYPEDPAERKLALELEDFFDEHAGHDMRRVGFWELRDHLDYGLEFMTTDQPRIRAAVGRAQLRVSFPIVWRYLSKRYTFNEEAVQRSRGTLAAALDRIETERAGGDYLVGDAFTVADLTGAALLYPLVWPPEFQYELPDPPPSAFLESVREHPARQWISETWRRHRGGSAQAFG
jgi:glutathione S-transferase